MNSLEVSNNYISSSELPGHVNLPMGIGINN